MKALVTGASGFIGYHLSQFLISKDITVYGTYFKNKKHLDKVNYIEINVQNNSEVLSLIKDVSPDYIFHLAAQSLVMPSWESPIETFEINIFSTLHIFDAVKKVRSKPRIILFGSSSEYGANKGKIKEEDTLEPNSPYAITKIAQEYLAKLYTKSYNFDIVCIRPFFIIGPGKKQDVLSDFSRGIVAIENGKQKELSVGNLKVIRDFVDIGDAIQAIWTITQKGEKGGVYNICSGNGIQLGVLLKKLISFSKKDIKITIDKNKLRPIDELVKIGDPTKLIDLGWSPKILIDETLKKTLQYWRNIEKNE